MSCDALGIDHSTPPEQVDEWYRLLCSLMAALIDDNTLAIYMTESSLMYPFNDQTINCLRADDPRSALQGELDLPVVQIADDDPRMKAAVKQARETWPEFLRAYESETGENFSVKAPVTHDGRTEFIWLEVTAIENETIYGLLANDPVDLGRLTLGSKVTVSVEDLNDWIYFDSSGELAGGFTVQAAQAALDEQRDK